MRVGSRVGLARCTVESTRTEKLKGPTVESSDYKPTDEGQMFIPAHFDKGRWNIHPELIDYLKKLELNVVAIRFVVDMGIVTWLGALMT